MFALTLLRSRLACRCQIMLASAYAAISTALFWCNFGTFAVQQPHLEFLEERIRSVPRKSKTCIDSR